MIALVPILFMFFSFVQLSKLATARLAVKHSAIIGARAAAVMANGKDNVPEAPDGTQQNEIEKAVKAGLGPWWQFDGPIMAVNVTVNDASTREDPYDWVEVKVKATYACRVPLGFLACAGFQRTLEETYRMPHQGARYRTYAR